jgi:exopolysaccharide production protein ExoY
MPDVTPLYSPMPLANMHSKVYSRESATEPGIQAVRAFIFVSSAPEVHIAWHSLARFVLYWQIRWLRRKGTEVTLVIGDTSMLHLATEEIGIGRDDDIEVLLWDRLDDIIVPHMANAEHILLLAGPMLLNCDPEQILARHTITNQAATVVRQRHGERLPVAYCCAAGELRARWPEWKAALQTYMSRPGAGLPLVKRMRSFSAPGEFVRTGDMREMRRLEALWEKCAPLAGLTGVPGRPGAYHVGLEEPAIASTSRVRGPVIIEEGVTIQDYASIGRWVLLERGSIIGQRAWVETAIIGTNADVRTRSCVYASVVAPQVIVNASQPILKGHVSTRDVVPQLLPNVEAYRAPSRSYVVGKRIVDIITALTALVILSPLLFFGVLLCLVTEGLPIFFRHERVGIHGTFFRVFKLRTMRRDAQALVHLQQLEASDRFKIPNDPRVTAVGHLLRKTSIDEIPQLLNVLAGQMSIVGPRPIVPKEGIRFGIYARDLVRVMPGMTGLWQISGRSSTTYARRIMLDVQYADQCSLWLDLKILLLSVPAVLFLRGSE